MHICFCYHRFYPSQGGVEITIMNLSKRLLQRGHKITVVTSNIPYRPEREIIEGIEVLRAKPIFEIFKVPIMPGYKKLLSGINADVIDVYGTVPNVSDVAVFYAKRKGIPCILSYQFDGNAESPLGELAARFYNRFINRKVVKEADKVIATSHSYAETSLVLRNFLDKVEILPIDGININQINSIERGNIREIYNLPSTNLILWVGRFVKYKGLEYALKAMKYIQNGILVIVGRGKLEGKIKGLVQDENLVERVRFLGFVSYEDVIKLFKASKVYVLSSISRGENFGRTALEAMACGTAVVASDIPGVNELVPDSCGIKAKPRNVRGLAESINLLLSDANLRTRMGESGRREAEKYSWENIVKRLEKLYTEVVK